MDDIKKFSILTQCNRFKGQVAIVTGSAQGLGRVIARRLGEEGATVVIADIQEERAIRTAKLLEEEVGSKFIPFVGDLSEIGVADQMVSDVYQQFGRIDVLVNNAAALIRMKLIDMSEDVLQKGIKWNIWNTLRCSKAVLPYMIKAKYGRIVNIGGEAFRMGTPFHTLLAGVGKGAIVGLTSTLAGEVLRDGITVNCISPAGMDTREDGDSNPPVSKFYDPNWNPPQVLDFLSRNLGENTGMGRLAHPTEVAAVVAFFASYEASYVTGQYIAVSGGLTML